MISDSEGEATAEPESEQINSRMLVVYFTYAENAALAEDVDVSSLCQHPSGKTAPSPETPGLVASMIAEATGADLFSLHTVEQYPDTYSAHGGPGTAGGVPTACGPELTGPAGEPCKL